MRPTIKTISTDMRDITRVFQNSAWPIGIFFVSRFAVFSIYALLGLYGITNARIDNWDAKHFLFIAEHGYGEKIPDLAWPAQAAFFPLFPMVINSIHRLSGASYLSSSLFAVSFFGMATALVLYKYAALFLNQKTAILSVSLFSFQPMSVFLTAPYTETLFLFLTISSLYLWHTDRTISGSVFAGLSIVTRITGLILLPILALKLYRSRKTISLPRSFISILASCIPFAIFLAFERNMFGDPFAYMAVQKTIWNHSLEFPWIVLRQLVDYAFHGSWYTIALKIDLFFLALSIGSLVALRARSSVPTELQLFGWGVILLSLLTSNPLSISRYLMTAIPLYFLWAEFLKEKHAATSIVLAFSGAWMALNCILFFTNRAVF